MLFFVSLLINSYPVAKIQGQTAQTAVPGNSALSESSPRIMPPDGAMFIVDQRFDIRVEAPSNAKGALRVTLDGQDISQWNNRNHLTGRGIDHTPLPPLSGSVAFLSRAWSFPKAGRHTLRAMADGATAAREV